MIALASEWIRCKDESGNRIEIDPRMLGDMFCNFARRVLGIIRICHDGVCG